MPELPFQMLNVLNSSLKVSVAVPARFFGSIAILLILLVDGGRIRRRSAGYRRHGTQVETTHGHGKQAVLVGPDECLRALLIWRISKVVRITGSSVPPEHRFSRCPYCSVSNF